MELKRVALVDQEEGASLAQLSRLSSDQLLAVQETRVGAQLQENKSH